jgi:hypothetical protein
MPKFTDFLYEEDVPRFKESLIALINGKENIYLFGGSGKYDIIRLCYNGLGFFDEDGHHLTGSSFIIEEREGGFKCKDEPEDEMNIFFRKIEPESIRRRVKIIKFKSKYFY